MLTTEDLNNNLVKKFKFRLTVRSLRQVDRTEIRRDCLHGIKSVNYIPFITTYATSKTETAMFRHVHDEKPQLKTLIRKFETLISESQNECRANCPMLQIIKPNLH